jgi:hypothetical protein
VADNAKIELSDITIGCLTMGDGAVVSLGELTSSPPTSAQNDNSTDVTSAASAATNDPPLAQADDITSVTPAIGAGDEAVISPITAGSVNITSSTPAVSASVANEVSPGSQTTSSTATVEGAVSTSFANTDGNALAVEETAISESVLPEIAMPIAALSAVSIDSTTTAPGIVADNLDTPSASLSLVEAIIAPETNTGKVTSLVLSAVASITVKQIDAAFYPDIKRLPDHFLVDATTLGRLIESRLDKSSTIGSTNNNNMLILDSLREGLLPLYRKLDKDYTISAAKNWQLYSTAFQTEAQLADSNPMDDFDFAQLTHTKKHTKQFETAVDEVLAEEKDILWP